MAEYVDIEKLANEVLASVKTSTKTASVEVSSLKTDIGNQIKQAAMQIRELGDGQVVTDADLAIIKSAGLMGGALGAIAGAPLGPAGMVAGGMAGNAIGNSLSPSTPNAGAMGAAPMAGGQPPAPNMPGKMASELGNELRKIAASVREQAANNEEIRLTKAAQMLTAAVGLKHLIG